MKLSNEQKRTIVKGAIIGFAGLSLYYILKGNSPARSVKKAVETPINVVEAVATEVKKVAKVSKEEFLKRMSEGRAKTKNSTMSKQEHDSQNKKSYWKW